MKTARHRAFKSEVFCQLARIPKALSNPRRLELIDLLAQSERSVEELAELTAMSFANTSQHLQVLRAAFLVTSRREASRVYYSLSSPAVFRAVQATREVGQMQLAELEQTVRTYLEGRERMETIDSDELQLRLRKDDVIVLDVRPEVEFRSGHIQGARSIPVRELRRRLAELPKKSPIVAYCRGPYCVYADEAVALLQREGFHAMRLDTGFPDWKAAGLPVAESKD
jgi:rhodanese-related sulfurtransferase